MPADQQPDLVYVIIHRETELPAVSRVFASEQAAQSAIDRLVSPLVTLDERRAEFEPLGVPVEW